MGDTVPKPADHGIETYATKKGTRYRVARYLTDGTRRSLSFTSKPEARAFRDFADRNGSDEAVRVYTSNLDGPRVLTLNEAWRRRQDRIKGGIKAGTHAANEGTAARSFLPTLGDYPVQTITPQVVQRWIDSRATTVSPITGRRMNPSTIGNEHGLLAAVLGDCVHDGLIATNPCARTVMPRAAVDAELVVLSEDELFGLLEHMDPWYRAFTYTLATTGMRINEATALRWRSISVTGGTIRVDRNTEIIRGARRVGSTKTQKAQRTLDIEDSTLAALATLPGDHAPEAFVFTTRHGGPVHDGRYREKVWHPARERSRLRHCTPHDLRHYHAATLLGQGLSIEAVAFRLGHSSTDVTYKTYSHLVPETRRRYVEAIDTVLGVRGRAMFAVTHSPPQALGT